MRFSSLNVGGQPAPRRNRFFSTDCRLWQVSIKNGFQKPINRLLPSPVGDGRRGAGYRRHLGRKAAVIVYNTKSNQLFFKKQHIKKKKPLRQYTKTAAQQTCCAAALICHAAVFNIPIIYTISFKNEKSEKL